MAEKTGLPGAAGSGYGESFRNLDNGQRGGGYPYVAGKDTATRGDCQVLLFIRWQICDHMIAKLRQRRGQRMAVRRLIYRRNELFDRWEDSVLEAGYGS